MKLKILLSCFIMAAFTLFSTAAYAIHPDCDGLPELEDQIECAINNGIEWLVDQQNGDGSWDTSCRVAATGLALTKLQERAYELGRDPFDTDSESPTYYEYAQNVIDGLDYLFTRVVTYGINNQTVGYTGRNDDPDTNGDGIGFAIQDCRQNYETGIAMMAIAASRKPARTVNIGGTEYTYKQVLQNVVDFIAWGQTDLPSGRGGWDYEARNNGGTRGDNSPSGYVVLGLRYAEASEFEFECTIPTWVKSELKIWVDYIQCDSNGGSGYSSPCSWVNVLKTGNLLFQAPLAASDDADPAAWYQSRVDAAIGYIQNHWNDPGGCGTGWKNPPHNQAMYNLMKGLTGLDIDTITVGASEIDWFLDPGQFADVLVGNQNADGSWPTDCWRGNPVSTCWALLTLEKIAPPPPVNVEVSLPECACDNEGYTVEITYTVERFNVDGTLNIYEDDILVDTVVLTNFTDTEVETVEVASDTPGIHTWKAELDVTPVGGGTSNQAEDEASLEVCETPVVEGIEDQTAPFGTFDLDNYLTFEDGLDVSWSYSGNDCLNVSIDGDNVVTITNPGDACQDPETIAFTASVECCDDVVCSDSDEAVFTPNQPPDCTNAYADPDCLWPPNHKFVDIAIMVTDPDDDPVTISIFSITSDEPTATDKGSGGAKHAPDASGVGTDSASLRSERSGKKDGRVYTINFMADDDRGGTCEGSVTVNVPHDQSEEDCPAIDSGQDYDATGIN